MCVHPENGFLKIQKERAQPFSSGHALPFAVPQTVEGVARGKFVIHTSTNCDTSTNRQSRQLQFFLLPASLVSLETDVLQPAIQLHLHKKLSSYCLKHFFFKN